MKLYERVALVAQEFSVGQPITNEELRRFKLSKDICKLVEKQIFRKVAPGVYTLDVNYEENSKARKKYQSFNDKMANLLEQYKVNDVISNKNLRALGFDSHMVADMVQQGYLSEHGYGEYKLLVSSYSPKEKNDDEPKIRGMGKKFNNLYEGVRSGRVLTTQELSSYGFTGNYLTKLVDLKVLRRVDMGLYEVIDLDFISKYRTPRRNAKEIDEIHELLVCGTMDAAYNYLHDYLMRVGLAHFEFLIVDLIKLSLMEPDLRFVQPIQVLTLLVDGKYVPDFNIYISYFYQAIRVGNKEIASIYFDILSGFNKNGLFDFDIGQLKQDLDGLLFGEALRGI